MAAAPSGLVPRLQDRYSLEQVLGSGGMATVYLARDLRDDSRVALKVLRPELVPILGPERFAREIRITSNLKHPNILPVLDSGCTEDGVSFYVTPYVDGGSLAQRLRREPQLPIADALEITRQIAYALETAHDQGIVHRDIKPSNILLADRRAILADFGLARAVDVATAEKLTESGIVLGTPAYMSPEQSAGGPLDRRSDIYSLGCVVFEMLAGTPPFSASSAQSLHARHAMDPPPSVRTVRPTVSPSLEHAINTALAKVPADRFGTAAAFAEALATGAYSLPLWRRAAKPLLAAGIVLAAVFGSWAVAGSRTGSLDRNKVVVYPLAERGERVLRAGVGEEVALLLGSALEHSEPLKWIDGWTWLDPSRRADVKLLDARTAGDIARARRARFYIDGTVIGSVDSSTVILRLNDARGDSLVDQVSSSGVAGSSVAQLGLTAVRQLLPRLLAPGRKVDIAPLSERSPAAIANWLQGEREYRQSQYVRALDYYRRALEEDSALSIAAVNGAQAADWMGYDDEARSFLAAALSHELDLPRKYAHLARGLQFFLSGSADSAVSRYRMALRLDPAWAAAWTALGDVYYHLLPTESPLDSLAEAAFTEARRADPDLLPPLYHLTEIALGRGELPRATTMLAAFRRSNPDPTWTLQLELMASCRTRGPAAMNWAAEVKAHAEEVFYAAKALSAAGAHWGCSESALRELLRSESLAANYRRASLLVLQSILVAERRYADVESLIDSAVAQGITDARGLYVLDAVAGAPFDRQAQAAMGDLPDGTRTLQAPRLWFEGSWQAHAGDSSRLATVVDQLDHRARSGGDPLDSLLAEAMAARLDLVRGDTARASTRLLALRPAAGRAYITWGLWQSLAAERMALAEILLAEGQPSRALEIASGFDHFEPVMFVLYWPRSLELRIRAATSLGRSDLAQRYAAQLGRIGRQDLLSNATRREPPQPRRPS